MKGVTEKNRRTIFIRMSWIVTRRGEGTDLKKTEKTERGEEVKQNQRANRKVSEQLKEW